MSDDLKLLVDFRSEVSAPDEAATERVYRLATGPRPRWRRLLFGHPWRRGRVLLVAAVVGLVLVPTALAFGGRIVDLFFGTTAPPAVKFVFSGDNRFAEMTMRAGFARLPHVEVNKAHGVIEIKTADGPEELWAAPNDQGGQSAFIDFAEQPPGSSARNVVTNVLPGAAQSSDVVPGLGFGFSDPVAPPAARITLHQIGWALHPSLVTVTGTVYVDAAIVRLTLADGSTSTLPVVERMFLGSLDKGAKVTQVTACDKAGNPVAHTVP
jgi:hypothetical protein